MSHNDHDSPPWCTVCESDGIELRDWDGEPVCRDCWDNRPENLMAWPEWHDLQDYEPRECQQCLRNEDRADAAADYAYDRSVDDALCGGGDA